VPRGFLALLRQSRAPLIAVAIALVVLQTLVAGLATAQAASLAAAGPFDAICHGVGGAGGADRPADGAPNSGKAWDVCCAFCAAAAPAVLPVAPPAAKRCEHAQVTQAVGGDIVVIARRAVRAGPSQAPPSFA
jgi:hypothetical protein